MNSTIAHRQDPWNKGKLIGQKSPLRLRDIWAIRVRLQLGLKTRELALFNLAIDSKLRACDLVKIKVRDISHGARIAPRAIILQQKTEAGPVRDHRAYSGLSDSMDSEGWPSIRGFPVPKSPARIPARIDSTIRKDSAWLGGCNRVRCLRVRDAHNAPDESVPNLSPDQEPAGSSAASGPHQAGEHCSVLGYRG